MIYKLCWFKVEKHKKSVIETNMNNINNQMNNTSMCVTNMQPYMYKMQQLSTDVVNFTRTVVAQDLSIENIMKWGTGIATDWWAHEQFTNLSNSKWLVPVLAIAVGYRVGYLRGRTQCRDMILWNLCAMVADVKDQTSEIQEMLSTQTECPDNGDQAEEEIFSIIDCIDICNRLLDENCRGQHPNTCKGYKRTLKALCECTNPHIAKNLPPMIWEYGTTNGENCEQIHTWVENMHLPPNFRPKKAACRSALLKAFPKQS